MKINSKDVNTIVDQIRKDLQEDTTLPPTLRSSIEMLLLVVTLLINKIGLNSRNSSKSPSSDPNRKKNTSKGESKNKPGGQKGHKGTSLEPVVEPDEIIVVEIDMTTLPPGQYQPGGFESRQVFDVDISSFVTEYQAQILLDQNGQSWVAPFPEDVIATTQYGPGVKANTVYMSQYQLIPYKRVEEQFRDQFQIPISAATVFNFNKDAFNRLEYFEQWVKDRLIKSPLINADETGINISSKRHWLHCASNNRYTLFQPHAKRGGEALKDTGILPLFSGTLCHDHWKPYFNFGKKHSLCNAHHLRELERAWEQDNQKWAKELQSLLTEINNTKQLASGSLKIITRRDFRKRYQNILLEAEKESPPPEEKEKKGRLKRSKSRNLLERLRNYEDEALLFMDDPIVPFTNNQAENDVRMTKVQQKISGCFRSMEGAAIFCRVRSYLSTCRKNGVSATSALRDLFHGKWPKFMSEP